jgi:hypothetical protein
MRTTKKNVKKHKNTKKTKTLKGGGGPKIPTYNTLSGPKKVPNVPGVPREGNYSKLKKSPTPKRGNHSKGQGQEQGHYNRLERPVYNRLMIRTPTEGSYITTTTLTSSPNYADKRGIPSTPKEGSYTTTLTSIPNYADTMGITSAPKEGSYIEYTPTEGSYITIPRESSNSATKKTKTSKLGGLLSKIAKRVQKITKKNKGSIPTPPPVETKQIYNTSKHVYEALEPIYANLKRNEPVYASIEETLIPKAKEPIYENPNSIYENLKPQSQEPIYENPNSIYENFKPPHENIYGEIGPPVNKGNLQSYYGSKPRTPTVKNINPASFKTLESYYGSKPRTPPTSQYSSVLARPYGNN